MKSNSYHFKNGVYIIPRLCIFGKSDSFNSGERFKKELIDVHNGDILDKALTDNMIEYRESLIGKQKIRSLSLVPTTECFGKCSYCYAKDTRADPSNYISKETLDIAMSKIDHSLDRVIIYGGDPAVNIDKLEDILKYFHDVDSICIVTGLLYSDENFNGIIDLCNKYNNTALCISIDPYSENYSRILPGISDVYTFLLNRIEKLVNNISNGDHRIGYRLTVSKNSVLTVKSTIEDILKLHTDKMHTQITVEFAHVESEMNSSEDAQYLFTVMRELHDKYDYPFISPSRRYLYDPIDDPAKLLNPLGDCGQLYSEITIDRDGNIHGCNESPTNASGLKVDNWPSINSDIKDKRVSIKEQCVDCDFLYLCGGFCYKHENQEAECEWRKLSILESLYWSIGRAKASYIDDIVFLNNDKLEIEVNKQK